MTEEEIVLQEMFNIGRNAGYRAGKDCMREMAAAVADRKNECYGDEVAKEIRDLK